MLFSVVFVSCVDTVNPDNVGGTTDSDNQGGDGTTDSGNQGGDGNTDSGNHGGGETDYTTDIEYADELALSYNRLENADLSFNFEITPAIAESANGLYNSSYVPDMAEDNGDGTTYTVKKEDFYNKFEDYVPEGYFDSEEQYLKSLSDMAKEIVDFVVDNITVLNRVVNYYSKSYYLGYDKENDVVTVCRQTKYSDSELVEIEKIIVYYDEDGDEVVKMDRMSYYPENKTDSVRIDNVIYCADKFYGFAQGSRNDGDGTYGTFNYTYAFNTDGYWRAVRGHYDVDNAYLTKEGEYSSANGSLYLDFLLENQSGFFYLTENLKAYRNGEYISNTEASKDDVMAFETSKSASDGVWYNYPGSVTFDFRYLDGWDEVSVSSEQNLDYYGSGTYFIMCKGYGDYILLSNGTKITPWSRWYKDKGWAICNYVEGTISDGYVDEQGNPIFVSEDEDYIAVTRFEGYCSPITDEMYTGFFDMHYFGDESNCLSMFDEFMKANGLSYLGNEDIFANLEVLDENKSAYTSDVFENIFGKDFSYESLVSIYNGRVEDFDALAEELNNVWNVQDIVAFEEMPERPADMGLINIADSVSGQATFSQTSADFSAVQATITKKVILREGRTYGIYVGFGNGEGAVDLGISDKQTYSLQEMTFAGKSVSLPSVIREGVYELKMFFGKYEDDKWLRLSEIADVPVAEFTSFSIEIPADGGKFVNTYSYVDGNAVLTVTFVDTAAPSITYNGATVGDSVVVTVDGEITAKEVAEMFTANDVYDGAIVVSAANFALNGTSLSENSKVSEGEYILTVSDKAGNFATITVTAAKAD